MIGKIINGDDATNIFIEEQDFLNDFSLQWSLMEVPSVSLILPIKYAKHLTGRSQIELIHDDWHYVGSLQTKTLNVRDGLLTASTSHIVGMLSKFTLPTNVTYKDMTVKEVGAKIKELWKDEENSVVNKFKMIFNKEVDKHKIEYEFSSESFLEFMNKLCEKTEDMYWRVCKDSPFVIEFGLFGEKKECFIHPMNHLIALEDISEDYSSLINSAVVKSDKADAGASSLTLRDIFEDKKRQKKGFPVVKTDRKSNSQRHYEYPPLPVFAPDMAEEEYAVLDEEGIALEAGEVYWGTITNNDTQATAKDNKEVTDEDRVKATEQLYKSAIRQLRNARRKVMYTITTDKLPQNMVNVGDKVKFLCNEDLVELTPCSKYYTKVMKLDDWFYVNKMTYNYSTANALTMTLELCKAIYSDREAILN